jgi:hypothetical protein
MRLCGGLTELSNLDMIRPGRNPNNLLSDVLSSHYLSADSAFQSKTYKDQDQRKHCRQPTCLLGTLQPRTLSRPYLSSVLLFNQKHTRLNFAYSDWSVYEFSEKNTIESVNGVFGCAVNSTYLSARADYLSMGTYLLSRVLDRQSSPS